MWNLYQKWKFSTFGAVYRPRALIGVKFCMAKWTHVPLCHAKFHTSQCNELPMRGKKCWFLASEWKWYGQFSALRQSCRKKNKKHTNTTFSHLQSTRVVWSPPQSLHGGRGRRAHSKRWKSFFDPTFRFSYSVQNVDIWPLSKEHIVAYCYIITAACNDIM